MEMIYNKISRPKSGSWVVEPMFELSGFIYIKSHMTLHVKSIAKNVN